MLTFLFSLLVGWPAILITSGVAAYGLAKSNHRYLVASAFMAFPFSWFISGFPLIRSPIFLLPLLLFGAGFAMRRDHEMIAWIIAIPFFLTVMLLFLLVLAGNS